MDASGLAASILVSLIGPTGFGGVLLVRQQRAKMRGEARAQNATADETDAKAQVLLSGEALRLFSTARTDADEARDDAREARAEAARCRRVSVELWASLDAYDLHVRRLEAHIREHGGTPPPRPSTLAPNIPAEP